MLLRNRALALIEDDLIMGESLVQRLELEGATVSWWRTGGEALIGLSQAFPDAVICDVDLPDRSGPDLFREIAGYEKAPPFFFITAYADIDQAIALLRHGARDYLVKPFAMREFLTRLQRVIAPAQPEIPRFPRLPSRHP